MGTGRRGLPANGRSCARQSRYERTAALIDATNCYPDWRERQDTFLNYTSESLDEPPTVTGHIVVSMDLISSEPDASLFVYVTEIEADGAHRYVTEGMLRALHRAHSEPPSTYRCTWPYHSLKRTDAHPLQPNVPARIEFALLPTSWTFSAGSRIRISSRSSALRLIFGPPGLRVSWQSEQRLSHERRLAVSTNGPSVHPH